MPHVAVKIVKTAEFSFTEKTGPEGCLSRLENGTVRSALELNLSGFMFYYNGSHKRTDVTPGADALFR